MSHMSKLEASEMNRDHTSKTIATFCANVWLGNARSDHCSGIVSGGGLPASISSVGLLSKPKQELGLNFLPRLRLGELR